MANPMVIFNHLEESVKEILFHRICFFYVEGFTSLLAKAELERRIHGVFVCRRAPKISNLLFANDSLPFCRATNNEAKEIADVLQVYAKTLR